MDEPMDEPMEATTAHSKDEPMDEPMDARLVPPTDGSMEPMSDLMSESRLELTTAFPLDVTLETR